LLQVCELLVDQIGSDADPVATAAGTDDGRIGTSYDLMRNAIKDADRGGWGSGFPDLGSSALTTRTATRSSTICSPAPRRLCRTVSPSTCSANVTCLQGR